MPGQRQPTAWGGRRTAWGVVGPSNIIDKYGWDVAYECQDVTTTTWPPAASGVTLDTGGTAPSTGNSTSIWTNLPDRMTDQGIRPGTEGFDDALFDWQNNDFHFRGIFDMETVQINDRVFRYTVGGVRFAQILAVTSVAMSFTVRNDADGGNYAATIGSLPSGALLVDWNVSGAQMNVYVNGVDRSPAAHTGPVNFQNGPDQIDVIGAGASNVLEGLFVFFGWRWGQAITLADHQADATELGL